MFYHFNQHFAVHENQTAAYNTKLKRSLVTEIGPHKNVVAVVPEHLFPRERLEAWQTIERQGHKVMNEIEEAVAAVLFHSTQYEIPIRKEYVRVISIGKRGTNISLVSCEPRRIRLEETFRVEVGEAGLTERIAGMLCGKMLSQITEIDNEKLMQKAEKFRVRVGANYQRRDFFEFQNAKEGREQVYRIARKEYELCCDKWLLPLFAAMDQFDNCCRIKGYPRPIATVLCGECCESQYIFEALQKKYDGSYVTNYRASEAAVLGGAIYARQLG